MGLNLSMGIRIILSIIIVIVAVIIVVYAHAKETNQREILKHRKKREKKATFDINVYAKNCSLIKKKEWLCQKNKGPCPYSFSGKIEFQDYTKDCNIIIRSRS